MKKIFLTLFAVSLFLLTFSAIAQGIDKPRYQIVTHRAGNYLGTIKIELFPLIAPNHTRNFDSLALALAFDSTAFHRVVPGFVIQGGDPNSIHGPISTWGNGNPNQPTVNAEFSAVQHNRGIIGAARDANINSATSQFYICVGSPTYLDGNYTVFGKVTEGMSIVDTIVSSPRDANDVPLQKIEMFVTYIGVNDTVPNVPALTTPANNSVNVSNLQNFKWSNVNGAVLYTVEFSLDSTFATVDFTRLVGTNQVGIPNVQGSSKYYWRVKANNGGHESAYSAVRAFTTKASPQLLLPQDLDTNVVLNPVCLWTKVPGANNYQLQIASNTSFNSASMVFYQAGITDTTFQASGLSPYTTYYWRVRGNQGTSLGLVSQVSTFVTGNTLSDESIMKEKPLVDWSTIYPNPVSEVLSLDLNLPQKSAIKMEIFNAGGKRMHASQTFFNAGKSTTHFDCSKFAPGIYLMNVMMDERKISHKFEVR